MWSGAAHAVTYTSRSQAPTAHAPDMWSGAAHAEAFAYKAECHSETQSPIHTHHDGLLWEGVDKVLQQVVGVVDAVRILTCSRPKCQYITSSSHPQSPRAHTAPPGSAQLLGAAYARQPCTVAV
jgi:hypothetical protein